jgi:hypothetical protein
MKAMNMNAPAITSGALRAADLDTRMNERRAMNALADQIAEARRLDDEMRRGAWTKPSIRANGCGGPCNQGRHPCPCPDACERSRTEDHSFTRGMLFAALVTVAACAVVVLLLPAVLP